MTDNAWPLIDLALLTCASVPLVILAFLWTISAQERSPKWIYLGSKWTTIVLFLPWLLVVTSLVSDLVSG